MIERLNLKTMTKNILSWLSVSLLALTTGFGQESVNDELSICYNKTTSLVFPFAITSVDRGSRDVLVQKAMGVENVLQVKAARKGFAETNLTVITADGKLHHFIVNYSEDPSKQTISVADASDIVPSDGLILTSDAINARDIILLSENALATNATGKVDRMNKYRMSLTLQSIFIDGDMIFYRLQLRNRSAISYDIKSLKFYIRDRRKVKRTSSQEIAAEPLYVFNDKDRVDGYGSAEMVFVLRKFTIPDGKTLHIDVFEANGGRNLSLKIDNSDILKARPITMNEKLLTITKK
jgi:conjugative transposon TraN protein